MADTDNLETLEAAESIRIEYKGETYVLQFDRASVDRAERMYGFKLNDLMTDVQMVTIHDMFTAAFAKNHPKLRPSAINEIYNRTPDKVGLYRELVQMYLTVASSVLDTEADEGNAASWSRA
jgi:hypothetical protein